MVHCHARGCEAITGHLAHTFLYEQGAAAQLAGIQFATVKNLNDGTFSLEDVKRKIRIYEFHEPITKLVLVENTHNMCGGKVLPMKFIDDLAIICRENNLKLHMDGSRIFNAAAYLNLPVSRIVRDCDTVNFALSKGLCAPVGSCLVGSKEFIEQARRTRKVLGGGMRQAGILAAAGIYALENNVKTLINDHVNARKIAEG